jgi:rare lipoprotein A (peptidoglycan hydrolase)
VFGVLVNSTYQRKKDNALSLGYAYLPPTYHKEASLTNFFKWLVSEIVLLLRVVLFVLVVSAVGRPLMALPTSVFVSYHHPGWHIGRASWYGPGFFHRFRADGRRYSRNEVFVASRSFTPGTVIQVINLKNRRRIDRLIVADRMPRNSSREFDLSVRAADMLGMRNAGVVLVAYQVINH